METNAYMSLVSFRLPSPGRLLPNSCCPEKDLVVLISRLAGTDRMSLWSSSRGTRVWETDIGNDNGNSQIVDIAWSPDGRTIVVVREPRLISLHSLQDGHVTSTLPLELPRSSPNILTGVWWFKDEKKAATSTIPDIFKRNNLIPGSSHALLRIMPLLDSLQEDPDKLTATDLFAFQGSHTRSTHKFSLPPALDTWPTLSPDYTAASISDPVHDKPGNDNTKLDEVDTSNVDSVLMVADNLGNLFCYLDGTFPLGVISSDVKLDFTSIIKHPSRPLFVGQPRFKRDDEDLLVGLRPARIEMPLLSQRMYRDFAKSSSTARELIWYCMRVVKEMHEAWYGSETNSGARELGPKWIQTLEQKQREQYGQERPNPILDLTYLLTTGRASEALLDFLGSGEQMSERGIQKWESTVTEALIKLRDFAEKRVAPALQRLHIVFEELQGWASLPKFVSFGLQISDITHCFELMSRGIIICGWLASITRRELLRFREFISWLRFEVNNINPSNEGNVARHDILEVNHYFMDGLAVSPIDKWFIGPVPQFTSADLGIPNYERTSLSRNLEYARSVANDPTQIAWQKTGPRKDLSNLDRNIEALIQELASRCGHIFHIASGAASRIAIVSFEPFLQSAQVPEKEPLPGKSVGFPFRERTILNEDGKFLQHLICQVSSPNNNTMLLAQIRVGIEASELPSEVGVALLECSFPEEEDQCSFDLLDADFFDDESVVIIYRLREGDKQTFIATVTYNDIGYQNLQYDGYVKVSTREDLMQDALELWKNGQLSEVKIPIDRRRALSGCKNGNVSIALNGRINRRVACVLDSTGTALETIDLEGDTDDMEVGDA